MLDGIILKIAFALFEYLEKRISRGSYAVDSDLDRKRLHLASDRLRLWLRQNGSGSGVKPDQNWAGNPKQDLHPD